MGTKNSSQKTEQSKSAVFGSEAFHKQEELSVGTIEQHKKVDGGRFIEVQAQAQVQAHINIFQGEHVKTGVKGVCHNFDREGSDIQIQMLFHKIKEA